MFLTMRYARRRAPPRRLLWAMAGIGAGIASLLLLSPTAVADDREDGAHIEQIAPGHSAVIRQQGLRNTATVDQTAGGSLNSSGDDDRQHGREREREREDDDHRGQSGGSTGNGLNRAGITQSGIDHNAGIVQRGFNLEASITQTGDRNTAHIAQEGAAHRAAVQQNGSNLAVDITQTGFGRSIEINQSGAGNGLPIVIRQR